MCEQCLCFYTNVFLSFLSYFCHARYFVWGLKTKYFKPWKVSEGLTAKADEKKLKPFNVFQGAKCEAKTLNEEFKN